MIDLDEPTTLRGSGNGQHLGWTFRLHRETDGSRWCALRYRSNAIVPASEILTVDGWRSTMQDDKPRTWWGTLQELDELLKGQS